MNNTDLYIGLPLQVCPQSVSSKLLDRDPTFKNVQEEGRQKVITNIT